MMSSTYAALSLRSGTVLRHFYPCWRPQCRVWGNALWLPGPGAQMPGGECVLWGCRMLLHTAGGTVFSSSRSQVNQAWQESFFGNIITCKCAPPCYVCSPPTSMAQCAPSQPPSRQALSTSHALACSRRSSALESTCTAQAPWCQVSLQNASVAVTYVY